MQNPLANIHWRFLLVRDDWGFQVNPLCHHDITSPFPPSGNEGYVRNRDVLHTAIKTKVLVLFRSCCLIGKSLKRVEVSCLFYVI